MKSCIYRTHNSTILMVWLVITQLYSSSLYVDSRTIAKSFNTSRKNHVSTVLNFGICDIAGCVSGVQTDEYIYWYGMLDRCYEKSGRSGASYLDCTVSQKFRRLSDFSRWCEKPNRF